MKDRYNGLVFALGSALLFGASAPVAKLLLGVVDPMLLAGLLYLGLGLGLSIWQISKSTIGAKNESCSSLKKQQLPWLVAIIFFGGVAGPILLMCSLKLLPASTTSLLLNLEAVLTMAIAALVFKEHYDKRLSLGMVAITAGGVILSLGGGCPGLMNGGALAAIGACLCWAIDNNLTRKISIADPEQIARYKGLAAGTVNLCLALANGSTLPGPNILTGSLLVGLFGYGVSLSMYVLRWAPIFGPIS